MLLLQQNRYRTKHEKETHLELELGLGLRIKIGTHSHSNYWIFVTHTRILQAHCHIAARWPKLSLNPNSNLHLTKHKLFILLDMDLINPVVKG